MNILIDELPISVDIAGVDTTIREDYRTSILFSLLMQDVELTDQEKLEHALHLYYPNLPHNLDDAIEAICWFYRCGKQDDATKATANGEPAKRVYSWDHDSQLIYAAFWQQYKIDLATATLHWWQFKALFDTLSDTTEFVKVMGYRAIEINDKMTREQKSYYQKMKRRYALPDDIFKNEEQQYNDIEQALMSGGDVQALLMR